MPMTADKLALAQRRQDVARRYLAREPLYQIAQSYGVDPAQISRDVKWLLKEWRKDAVMAIDERMAIEIAKINRLEEVAWECLERSKKDAESHEASAIKGRTAKETVKEQGTDAKGKKVTRTSVSNVALPVLEKSSRKVEGQAGDPRWHAQILACVEMRCRILGLDKRAGAGNTTVVTVIGGIDLAQITGAKPDLDYDRTPQLPP